MEKIMNVVPLGMFVEIAVSILLLLTIGYCFVLNNRLKKLHADKDALKQMVADLMKATTLANDAIVTLRKSAGEADNMLSSRLKEADRFAVELANHISSGQSVLERITKIADAANKDRKNEALEKKSKANIALDRLREYQRRKGKAA